MKCANFADVYVCSMRCGVCWEGVPPSVNELIHSIVPGRTPIKSPILSESDFSTVVTCC